MNVSHTDFREKTSRGSGYYPQFARNIHSPSLLSTFSSSCRAGEREKYPMVNPIPFLRVNPIPFPKEMAQRSLFWGNKPQSLCQILRVEHVQWIKGIPRNIMDLLDAGKLRPWKVSLWNSVILLRNWEVLFGNWEILLRNGQLYLGMGMFIWDLPGQGCQKNGEY